MDLAEAVAAYGAAWNETDEAKRRTLLEQSWADDAVYQDPTGRAEGREALVAHIGGFHAMMPATSSTRRAVSIPMATSSGSRGSCAARTATS